MELQDFINQKENELVTLKSDYEALCVQLNNSCPHVCIDCNSKRTTVQDQVTSFSQKINDLTETINRLKIIN